MVGKIFNSYPNLILFPVKPNEVATFFGTQEIVKDKADEPEKMEKEFRAISPQQIRKVANKLFVNSKLNLAIVGNIKSPQALRKVFKI